jgi:hypothetical protein
MFREGALYVPENLATRIVVWMQNSIIEPLLCLLGAVRYVISSRYVLTSINS